MCVILCAIPKVEAWLDLPAAIDYRNALQLAAVVDIGDAHLDEVCGCSDVDESKLPRVMKRSAWLQVYFQRLTEQQRIRALLASDSLPEERHHAFDAITNAWRRLVAVIRWRCGILLRSRWWRGPRLSGRQ
jgi:hypothetical protein